MRKRRGQIKEIGKGKVGGKERNQREEKGSQKKN
jgi:hypothetical protein